MKLCPALQPMDCKSSVSRVHGFSRQEHWSGQPFPSPGDLPHPGIEPRSPALRADSLLHEHQGRQNQFTFSGHNSFLRRAHGNYCLPQSEFSFNVSFFIDSQIFISGFIFFLEVHLLCSFVLRSQHVISPPYFHLLVKVSLFLLLKIILVHGS